MGMNRKQIDDRIEAYAEAVRNKDLESMPLPLPSGPLK